MKQSAMQAKAPERVHIDWLQSRWGNIGLRVLAVILSYWLAGELATALSFVWSLPQEQAELLARLLAFIAPIPVVIAVFAVQSPIKALLIVLVPLVACRFVSLGFVLWHVFLHGVPL